MLSVTANAGLMRLLISSLKNVINAFYPAWQGRVTRPQGEGKEGGRGSWLLLMRELATKLTEGEIVSIFPQRKASLAIHAVYKTAIHETVGFNSRPQGQFIFWCDEKIIAKRAVSY